MAESPRWRQSSAAGAAELALPQCLNSRTVSQGEHTVRYSRRTPDRMDCRRRGRSCERPQSFPACNRFRVSDLRRNRRLRRDVCRRELATSHRSRHGACPAAKASPPVTSVTISSRPAERRQGVEGSNRRRIAVGIVILPGQQHRSQTGPSPEGPSRAMSNRHLPRPLGSCVFCCAPGSMHHPRTRRLLSGRNPPQLPRGPDLEGRIGRAGSRPPRHGRRCGPA